jgi:hypothetical protein
MVIKYSGWRQGQAFKSIGGIMARLSIEMIPELHRVIKGEASLRGVSIRTFVIDAIHEQMRKTHKMSDFGKHECPLCKIYEPRDVSYKKPRKTHYHSASETLRAVKMK